MSSAKLSQVVEPVCYKDTSDKTVQESANRGKRLAFDASMLASSSSTVKSEVPQLPEPNQNRDIGNSFWDKASLIHVAKGIPCPQVLSKPLFILAVSL